MSATELDRRTGRLALTVLLGAATLRILAAVIAGFIALGQHDDLNGAGFGNGRLHVGEVLNAFGAAGDGVGALLAAAPVALVWWLSRHAAVARSRVAWARAVLALTAVLTVVSAASVVVLDLEQVPERLSLIIGFSVAYLVVCLGGMLVLSGLRDVDADRPDPDARDSDGIEPLLFAVDRGNGEVFAFFSYAQARRAISPYSVEENEFAFYTDEGMVVDASAADLVTRFEPTVEDRREDLMRALRRFAQAKDLTVAEPQEPMSYAVPISDWQWLELWPGWLRPLGRIVRRLQGSAT